MKKIKIDRELLLNKLNILEKAYPNKTTIPALQFLKFDNGKLTTSDSQTVMITKIDYEIIEKNENEEFEFKTLIPFKTLKNVVSKLNDTNIFLELVDNQIIITCDKSVYTLNTMSFSDYPNISISKLEKCFKITSNELKNIIKSTNFACSTNEKRPILTGVNFKLENNSLNVVATDSYRLSKYTKENEENNNDTFNFTIQNKNLNDLLKLIPNDIELNIRYSDKEIIFDFDGILYKTRLLEGTYPDTSRLLTFGYDSKCEINRQELINAIDRVSIFRNEDIDYSVVIMNFKNNEIEITCADKEVGNAKEVLECVNEKEIKIACGSEYIIDALNVFTTENVNINISDELKPFTITSDDEINIVELLLPVKIEE